MLNADNYLKLIAKLMNRLNHKMAGIFQISISAIWIFRNLFIIYDYRVHYEILRLFLIPQWILFVQAIFGFIGVFLGILEFQKKLNVKIGYLIVGLTCLIGFGIELILISY